MAKNQKKETVVKLQKIYNVMLNAQKLAEADHGNEGTWNYPKKDDYTEIDSFIQTYLAPYLNIIQSCKRGETGCYNEKIYGMNGSEMNNFALNKPRFVLNDGMTIFFSSIIDEYLSVHVDINGAIGPNKMGKDIFRFDYAKQIGFRTVDQGAHTREELIEKARYGCNKTAIEAAFCSTLIQYDGWEIKDDYPW